MSMYACRKQAFYIMYLKLPKDVLFCLYPLVTDVNIFLFEKQNTYVVRCQEIIKRPHV